MKRQVLFFASLFLTSCQACVEDDKLIKLECIPGDELVCDEYGQDFPSADVDDIAQRAGQCSYGLVRLMVGPNVLEPRGHQRRSVMELIMTVMQLLTSHIPRNISCVGFKRM